MRSFLFLLLVGDHEQSTSITNVTKQQSTREITQQSSQTLSLVSSLPLVGCSVVIWPHKKAGIQTINCKGI
jgi:hypothetical protein